MNLDNVQKCYQIFYAELNGKENQEFTIGQISVDDKAHFERDLIQRLGQQLSTEEQKRFLEEVYQLGPLDQIFEMSGLTEILVNGPSSIWLEINGKIVRHKDYFFSDHSYLKIIERICHEAKSYFNLENPSVESKFRQFRLSIAGEALTHSFPLLSLRRHPDNPWTLEKLIEQDWCQPQEAETLRNLIRQRKNFLVVGGTGSGKTSLTNALLAEIFSDERAIIIEDTSELAVPNQLSAKLLTRMDIKGGLTEINQADLLKKTLRIRPDRLVMGEIRGSESKDFLMMLSTGHPGSFGTLHAQDAHQALMRLEMLIQMGAPQWNTLTIRRLIQISLEYLIVTERTMSGARKLKGIYRVQSLEDWGFILESVTAISR